MSSVKFIKPQIIPIILVVISFFINNYSLATHLVKSKVVNFPERYASTIFGEVNQELDIVYGQAKTQAGTIQKLKMDIYTPKGDEQVNRPLIIFAHGGYFLFGDKTGFEDECDFFARSGYVVATINYRLIDVPESDFVSKKAVVDAVNDLKAAVRFFNKDHATENTYRIDPNQIFIGGYSAGAVASLHYAYANTVQDVIQLGGEDLLDYVMECGGMEGASGNQGYATEVKGVINMAGSLQSANLIDDHEPILISLQGTNDQIVPYMSGKTGETNVVTEGAGLLHRRAEQIGLKNYLLSIPDEGHLARFYCENCISLIRGFIFENLVLN